MNDRNTPIEDHNTPAFLHDVVFRSILGSGYYVCMNCRFVAFCHRSVSQATSIVCNPGIILNPIEANCQNRRDESGLLFDYPQAPPRRLLISVSVWDWKPLHSSIPLPDIYPCLFPRSKDCQPQSEFPVCILLRPFHPYTACPATW